ncbi:hypothetical protein B0H19DRAFT_931632 [Mycena capillaripes]|nr:hypothetical protein B0H19DRAFT_931632 [Mycena capillaripes]
MTSLNNPEPRATDDNSRVQATAVPVSACELRPKSKIQRQEAILVQSPAPFHWKALKLSQPFGRLKRIIFNLLCITSFGHAGLEPIWAAIRLEEEGDDSIWSEGINQTCDWLNNMLLVASLLLATSAVFITTTPPRASMVNFIGGIIVASVCVLVSSKARPYWAEQVLYANRFHVYSTLIMLSYPFFSIGAAAVLLAFGM